jgi:hypothetical protein
MSPTPSFWSLKPRWCQPWSIVATGVALIGGSWWWPHRWWLTLPLSALVLLWWWVFLVLAPLAYRESVATVSAVADGSPASTGPADGSPPLP